LKLQAAIKYEEEDLQGAKVMCTLVMVRTALIDIN
jgi:hypothetical protein